MDFPLKVILLLGFLSHPNQWILQNRRMQSSIKITPCYQKKNEDPKRFIFLCFLLLFQENIISSSNLHQVQVTEASAALLDELDSLELEYETKAPLSVGGTPTPAIHHSHSSSSPQQPHHVQFQTHSSHPYSPQPQQSNPQSSFSQGQQQGPSVAPTNPTEIYAGVSAQLDKLQTTSSGFQRRYLQSCPYHPPIFSTSQNHAGLIARKVKEVSEILNCPPPPSPQQALSLSIAVITIVDGVVSFYDHLPSNESLSAYLRVLNATVAALDPAYRCLEHAFRSNDISSSPLKSYLLEVLKVLKLIL